jgi:class 3 adenylate cyclase
MRARIKLLLNTVSISLILLAAVLFFVHLLYTWDLNERVNRMQRDRLKFILSLFDERVAALRMEARDTGRDIGGIDHTYIKIVQSVTDYFDLDDGTQVLVFMRSTGEIIHPSTGYQERTASSEIMEGTAEASEGELNLKDRLGYFVQYPDPDLTFLIYSLKRDAFLHRNQLLVTLSALVAVFILFLLINLRNVIMRWSSFLDHMSASFSDVIRGKRNVPERIDDIYADEFSEFAERYNSMLDRVASLFRQLEERLRSLFKQRDSLKKMVFFYKKYIPDEAMLRMSEKDVEEVVSRRQEVSSLSVELVHFLEPLSDLHPQVVTDELSDFHGFIKEEVVKRNGIINFTHGNYINIVYGVPHADEMAFVHACRGARKIADWIDARNRPERNMSGVKWNVRFGVNRGLAHTGIVGLDYMVIGEVVERSSRMLDFAKEFGVLLVADSVDTLERQEDMLYRKLDMVAAADGSTMPIYEVFLRDHRMIPQAIKLYTHGLEMFHEGRYEIAALEFKKANAVLDGDSPSRIFLNRCEIAIKGVEKPSMSS